MFIAKGYRNREGTAASDNAVDANGAAVQSDQFLDQGQAYAAALDRTATGVFHPAKAFEQMRQFVGRDPDTGIADGDFGMAAIWRRPCLHRDFTFEGEFERIRKQVEDHL